MYCYGSGAGYGRFIDRVEQPLFVPGQKGTDKSGTRKATSCRHVALSASPLKDRQGGSEPLRRKPQAG